MKILIVEDDVGLAAVLRRGLLGPGMWSTSSTTELRAKPARPAGPTISSF
jgi:hypothetical protein